MHQRRHGRAERRPESDEMAVQSCTFVAGVMRDLQLPQHATGGGSPNSVRAAPIGTVPALDRRVYDP